MWLLLCYTVIHELQYYRLRHIRNCRVLTSAAEAKLRPKKFKFSLPPSYFRTHSLGGTLEKQHCIRETMTVCKLRRLSKRPLSGQSWTFLDIPPEFYSYHLRTSTQLHVSYCLSFIKVADVFTTCGQKKASGMNFSIRSSVMKCQVPSGTVTRRYGVIRGSLQPPFMYRRPVITYNNNSIMDNFAFTDSLVHQFVPDKKTAHLMSRHNDVRSNTSMINGDTLFPTLSWFTGESTWWRMTSCDRNFIFYLTLDLYCRMCGLHVYLIIMSWFSLNTSVRSHMKFWQLYRIRALKNFLAKLVLIYRKNSFLVNGPL